MQKRVVVVGYGRVGKCAVQAVQAAPDLELVGLVRHDGGTEDGIRGMSPAEACGAADAALLCVPTRRVRETALFYLQRGICTVDGFDLHGDIPALRTELDAAARANDTVAVTAAGWDPGSDSVVRTLMEACAPQGLTYTNFGPGMSMGHTVAAKQAAGVADAMSITVPLGAGQHRRVVYVELKAGASLEAVRRELRRDSYFSQDETEVIAVKDLQGYVSAGHRVHMVRCGASGEAHNQNFEYKMSIHNPALTGQILVCCARAGMRQPAGAYTMVELPAVDLLPGDRSEWIARLV